MNVAVVVAFAAALALGACGGDSDSTTDAGSTGAPAADGGAVTGDAIVIKDFKFSPETIKVKAGATIKVTNEDSATHTLTAKDKSVDTKNLDEGASATITLTKAGKVEYVCEIHDYMTGTIEVG